VLAVLNRLIWPSRAALVLCLPVAVACATLPQPSTTPTQAAAGAAGSILPNAQGSVKFLVIGDSGTGGREQYEVASRIADAHHQFPFTFALMLGDNLYGADNAAAYRNKFERPYSPLLDAGVKFYASLGNHDDASQRFYERFNMGGERYYTHTSGDVGFFVFDSTYMSREQLRWADDELSRSNHKWKIAYMHHPLYSSGQRHGATVPLRDALEPLFAKYGVDVVFAGHEHFYERLNPQGGIVYIIQGGAAKLRRGNIRKNSPQTAKGFDADRSFTLVEIAGDQMFLETRSRLGTVVDTAAIKRREVAGSSSE
jgi:predicted phosphodiesterase